MKCKNHSIALVESITEAVRSATKQTEASPADNT